MMDELPLMNNLVKRHPDVYKQEWKCVMCLQEQESWSHLWRCPHLAPRIAVLIQKTKSACVNLIKDIRPVLPSTFDNTWNSLSCWDLPTTNTNHVTFDLIIKGFIPTAFTTAISTVVNKKETSAIIDSVISVAQTVFREEIWSYRCDLFTEWEASKGITTAIKKSSSAGFVRSRASVNNCHSNSPSIPDRWKSWIAQAIDTGRP